MSRGHPSRVQLGAWFDEELEAWDAFELGVHIDRCWRCRRRVRDLERVQSVLRGQPAPPPLQHTATPGAFGHRLRLLVPAVAVVVLAVAVGSLTVATTDRPHEAASRADLSTTPSAPASEDPTVTPPTSPAGGVAAGSPGGSATGEPQPPTDGQQQTPPLRLGVLVATSGPLTEPSAEMVRAVRQVAAAATAGGGVSGRGVEVVVIDVADRAALGSLRTNVDVLVGGLAPTTTSVDVPWLLPADPDLVGPGVVAAELTPLAAGRRLADDLVEGGLDGTVAVVVGDGPEAALADGVAQRLPVRQQQAAAPTTTCDQELFELHRPGVVALAIAGPPELVERCADAAARQGWRPPGGLLVPPSAAHAGLALVPSAQLARTVLGLPWPTDTTSGAARFRTAVPDARSYQALVAFAGAELAIDAARRYGTPTLDAIASGTWATDLIAFRGTTNTGATVVTAHSGGWTRR